MFHLVGDGAAVAVTIHDVARSGRSRRSRRSWSIPRSSRSRPCCSPSALASLVAFAVSRYTWMFNVTLLIGFTARQHAAAAAEDDRDTAEVPAQRRHRLPGGAVRMQCEVAGAAEQRLEAHLRLD